MLLVCEQKYLHTFALCLNFERYSRSFRDALSWYLLGFVVTFSPDTKSDNARTTAKEKCRPSKDYSRVRTKGRSKLKTNFNRKKGDCVLHCNLQKGMSVTTPLETILAKARLTTNASGRRPGSL